jgi:hypothetical protein
MFHVYIYKGKLEVLSFEADNYMSALVDARSSMFALEADRFELYKWSGEIYTERATDHN